MSLFSFLNRSCVGLNQFMRVCLCPMRWWVLNISPLLTPNYYTSNPPPPPPPPHQDFSLGLIRTWQNSNQECSGWENGQFNRIEKVRYEPPSSPHFKTSLGMRWREKLAFDRCWILFEPRIITPAKFSMLYYDIAGITVRISINSFGLYRCSPKPWCALLEGTFFTYGWESVEPITNWGISSLT